MRFNLLGQFEITSDDGQSFLLSKSKISQLLGLLVVQNGETVGVDSLIEEIWGENVPRSALTTLQTYIYHARRQFGEMVGGQDVLVTRPSGYAIQVPDDAIDVRIFGRLVEQGRRLLEEGRTQEAADRLDEALALWKGPVLAGMMIGPVVDAHITYLNELRFAATELRIEAVQRLGRHQELVPQLRFLVVENPLNENLHAQLIKALHRCGRRAEALQAYRNLWRILDVELGVEPAPELQLLQHELLARGTARPAALHR